MEAREHILILDFGSQYNQLIARRVREAHVYCQIVPHDLPVDTIREMKPSGLVLSGGPASVYSNGVPLPDPEIFALGVPVLGICYGMQAMAHLLGGTVKPGTRREYGRAELEVDHDVDLFSGTTARFDCWMSHGDAVDVLPSGFQRLAHTTNAENASMGDPDRKLFGVQFHPEVAHTTHGRELIENFLFRICGCPGEWTMASFIDEAVESIRHTVGDARVVLGLSGGVDSSVAAALIDHAIGQQLSCIFIDNGLLREGEVDDVRHTFGDHFQLDLHVVKARDQFLERLSNVTDPEEKRRAIGHVFVDVFEAEAKRLGTVDFLAQGTLYPDVIESQSAFGGPSSTIKTHHNVGGLPERMRLKLLEPLRDLFKDEVRQLGAELGLPDELLWRHPFPGPGLAVRIVGEVTVEHLAMVRAADARLIDEIVQAGLYRDIWQAFAVLLPVKSVGVMGDERTYEHTIAVRAVTSQDGMTADWAVIPPDVMGRISNRIINEVQGINRVVYDVSSKPPATIEWE